MKKTIFTLILTFLMTTTTSTYAVERETPTAPKPNFAAATPVAMVERAEEPSFSTTLSVVKTWLTATVEERAGSCGVVGKTLKYDVRITNKGSDLKSVFFVEDLTMQVKFLSALPSQGTCAFKDDRWIECDLGPIRDGGEANIAIRVFPIHNYDGHMYSTIGVDENDVGIEAESNQVWLDQCVTGEKDWKGAVPPALSANLQNSLKFIWDSDSGKTDDEPDNQTDDQTDEQSSQQADAPEVGQDNDSMAPQETPSSEDPGEDSEGGASEAGGAIPSLPFNGPFIGPSKDPSRQGQRNGIMTSGPDRVADSPTAETGNAGGEPITKALAAPGGGCSLIRER